MFGNWRWSPYKAIISSDMLCAYSATGITTHAYQLLHQHEYCSQHQCSEALSLVDDQLLLAVVECLMRLENESGDLLLWQRDLA